ncbi:NADH-dependent flavin oxidoreductase [Bacillus wiedmannii]|uniref:NADH-dependent flavin oxidoreductase n=1 Tax=Bacillus wiedmannii TaxID=1890302 RepID=UPI003D966D02
MSKQYPSIFKPITLSSGVELKNRIIMAPMTTSASTVSGDVTEEELIYYARRAKSGIGAVITSCAHVEPLGVGFKDSMGAEGDARIPSLRNLANAIKDNGAKAILQIFHAGRMTNSTLLNGTQPVSASNIPALRPNAETPREMSNEEIEKTIQAFGEATRRAIEAGFDGVEIHGANTFLIQQFFSPHSNRRTDKWGGNVESRMAFPLAVVESVKEAVKTYAKNPFIVGYRLSPEEREQPGITMDDTIKLVQVLATKELDYLHASVGNFFAGSLRDSEDTVSRVQLIQEAVGNEIPVIGVGALQTAEQVEKALKVTPLVALGHALIMDPEWLEKVKEGKEDTIFDALYRSEKVDIDLPKALWDKLINTPGWFNVVD